MSQAMLTTPEPRAAVRDEPPAPPPRSPRPGRRRERGVLAAGLAGSVLLHLLLLALSPLFVRFGEPPGEPASPVYVPPASESGLRVYRLAAPGQGAPRLEDVERPDERVTVVARPPSGGGAASRPSTGPSGGSLSSVERLRPRVDDERLWVAPNAGAALDDDEFRMRQRVRDQIHAVNDSLLTEAERAARLGDLTVSDGKGGRWGLSKEGLNLGKLTVPLPFAIQMPPTEAAKARITEWNETQAGADRARIRSRFDERVEAIRERKDRERGN